MGQPGTFTLKHIDRLGAQSSEGTAGASGMACAGGTASAGGMAGAGGPAGDDCCWGEGSEGGDTGDDEVQEHAGEGWLGLPDHCCQDKKNLSDQN